MKKSFLSLYIMVALSATAFSQVAPDFTANDCDGISHNLYTELAQGKVIVLNWVMPCDACVGPSLTAYNVSQSFADPNVLYYLIDDAGNTSCTSVSSWATNHGIGTNLTVFSTSSIVEADYGGVGMPHVAVVGLNGTYFFNELNADAGNSTEIENAITSALALTGIHENTSNLFSLSVYPNPSSDQMLLNYFLQTATDVTVEIVNELKQVVASYPLQKQNAGNHNYSFDVKNFVEGNYFIQFNAAQEIATIKFTVIH